MNLLSSIIKYNPKELQIISAIKDNKSTLLKELDSNGKIRAKLQNRGLLIATSEDRKYLIADPYLSNMAADKIETLSKVNFVVKTIFTLSLGFMFLASPLITFAATFSPTITLAVAPLSIFGIFLVARGFSKIIENNRNKESLLLKQETAKLKQQLHEGAERQKLCRFYNIVLDSYPSLHRDLDGNTHGSKEYAAMSNDIKAFIVQESNTLTVEEKSRLQTCSELLNAGEKLCSLSDIFSDGKKFVQQIMHQLDKLEDGNVLLIPGCAKKHAFIYEVKRTTEGYHFTIVNTGSDEPLDHRITTILRRNIKADLKTKRSFDKHKINKISHKSYLCKRALLNPGFLESLHYSKVKDKPMKDLLQKINSSLIDRGATPKHGRQHHSQGRGSCKTKSISNWLKGELGKEFECVYARFKVFRTEKLQQELKKWEQGIDIELLKSFYQVSTKEELDIKRNERDAAVKTVYEKRLKKMRALLRS